MIAIEHERDDIVHYLMDTFSGIDLDKCDSQYGNTALHLACIKEDVNIV